MQAATLPSVLRPRGFTAFALTFALVAATALSSGCHRQDAKTELSFPPSGSVRILPRQIANSDQKLEWQWTLLGERNWRKASASGATLTLSDTYPINDASTRGGCNVWLCDLTVTRDAPGSVPHWTARIEGTDGVTATTHGDVAQAGNGTLSDAVPILSQNDDTPRLPADLRLATLGDQTLTLHIPL